MKAMGANSENESSDINKRDRTLDLLRNFGATATSGDPSSKTLEVNSLDGSSSFRSSIQTLDLLRNFRSVATASWEPPLETRFVSGKRKPGPSLELTLGIPGMKPPKKKFCKSQQPPLPNLPPDLPPVFKKHIESLGAQEVQLVMQKVLTFSDLSSHLARLLLPENQMMTGMSFLRTEEMARLNEKQDIAVGVITSNLVEKKLKFKLWLMGKKERVVGGPKPKATRVYSLQGGWVGFADKNELKENDRVQLWSFRVNNETRSDPLMFAIVKLGGNNNEDRDDRQGGGDGLSLTLRL